MHPIPYSRILQNNAFEKPQCLVVAGEESPSLGRELIQGIAGVLRRNEL